MKRAVTSTPRAQGKVADASAKGGGGDAVKTGKIVTPPKPSRAAVTPPQPAKILASLESQWQLGGAYPPTAPGDPTIPRRPRGSLAERYRRGIC